MVGFINDYEVLANKVVLSRIMIEVFRVKWEGVEVRMNIISYILINY